MDFCHRLRRWSSLLVLLSSGPAQAFAGEIDAVGVVNEAVEDGVGICRVADEGVPFVDGDLTGEDGRAAPIALLEDLVEIMTSAGVEGFEAPIVENEEMGAAETAKRRA